MAIPTVTRTGASTWVDAITLACEMGHKPKFRSGITAMVGEELATPLLAAWDIFCVAFMVVLQADDNGFKIDYTGGEPQDQAPGA
jgi:hypothetical protein